MKAMVQRGLSYLGSWPAICSKAVAEGVVSLVIKTSGGSHRGTQCDALRQLACCDEPPKRDQQLARQRNNHRFAAPLGVLSAGIVPARQRTILLKQEEAPGQLDHAMPHPRISGFGEALLITLR